MTNKDDTIPVKCVKCGYCCTQSACLYGEYDEEIKKCKYLNSKMLCDRYAFILEQPFSKITPAFGAGCCSPLFNIMRAKKIKETLKSRARSTTG